MSNVPEQYVNK